MYQLEQKKVAELKVSEFFFLIKKRFQSYILEINPTHLHCCTINFFFLFFYSLLLKLNQ